MPNVLEHVGVSDRGQDRREVVLQAAVVEAGFAKPCPAAAAVIEVRQPETLNLGTARFSRGAEAPGDGFGIAVPVGRAQQADDFHPWSSRSW